MFSVFDITNRGYLTQAQYLKGCILYVGHVGHLRLSRRLILMFCSTALNAVGVSAPVLQVPQGDCIDKKTFVSYM
jgi:hypothetical protein